MNQNGTLACVLFLSLTGTVQACDLIKDPRPSWEEMIDQADVVFVGKVVAILPETATGWGDRAVFQVDSRVKGDIGETFEAAQGMNTCQTEFRIGAWVIFAGTSLTADGGTQVTYAEDTGWDPTVFLSDPPTPKQIAQLEYLKQVTEDRYGIVK